MTVFVAAVGDANDYRTWSGIPFHFLRAGQAAGVLDTGLALSAAGWRWNARRIFWNLKELISTGRRGGYQFTEGFLSRLWRQAEPLYPRDVVISCFPLLPKSVRTDPSIQKWFFIDQTLSQLFFYYGVADTISPRTCEDALAREDLNYRSAKGIIAHSKWAAASLANDYGVPTEKIHVVIPGANLDRLAYERWAARREGIEGRESAGSLSLVFVGNYWARKGLDRLIDAFSIAKSHGAAVTLKIIGFPRESAPLRYWSLPGISWLGSIDKRTEAERFMNELDECDIGCLLSRQEAGGIVLREYHALGLAALAPDTGGAPEHTIAEAAILVSPEMNNSSIAAIITQLASNPARVAAMKRAAWERRHEFTWDHAVAQIARNIRVGPELSSIPG